MAEEASSHNETQDMMPSVLSTDEEKSVKREDIVASLDYVPPAVDQVIAETFAGRGILLVSDLETACRPS
jgi:hypothetical protein